MLCGIEVEFEAEGFKGFGFIPILIGLIIFAVIATFVIIAIVKAVKRTKSATSTISSIFKKTFDNVEAKLDNEKAKYEQISCPYCNATNKGNDTKCSGCGAPLKREDNE